MVEVLKLDSRDDGRLEILPMMVVIGTLIAVVWMISLWSQQERFKLGDWIDFGWASSVGILALSYCALGTGNPVRRLVLGACIAFWSLRLCGRIYHERIRSKREDARYASLRANWGDQASRNFLLLFIGQGLLASILTVPFALLSAAMSQPRIIEILATLALLSISLIGAEIADKQLQSFKRIPENAGKVCASGLWRFSRHPNYFFEWLHWWCYLPLSFGASYGAVTLIGPAIMFVLLVFVTGIPPAEAQALRSRGDDYREYQRTTSAFIPWIPARGGSRN